MLTEAGFDLRAPSTKLPLESIIRIAYPYKKIDASIASVIINELYSDGLISTKGLNSTIVYNRGFDIAKEFIEFISQKTKI